MLHILLLIVKIIGIILAVIIGLLLVAVLLILFVPVRYRIRAAGNLKDKETFYMEIKITWLLHIVNILFSYPKAAYIRARIFCFTLFNSSRQGKTERIKKTNNKQKKRKKKQGWPNQPKAEHNQPPVSVIQAETDESPTDDPAPAGRAQKSTALDESQAAPDEKEATEGRIKTFISWLQRLFKKLIQILKNIEYTAKDFCDKIRKIIENLNFYLEILQGEVFKAAFGISKKQLFKILRNIRPEKCDIRLTLGTGDPAGTGQILALYGMAYPFIGNNVSIQADFESRIVEGSLYIKGSITAFTFLAAAFTIYKDKNIRQLLKLLKREEA